MDPDDGPGRIEPLAIISIVILGALFCCNFVIANCPEKLGLVPVNTSIANSYFWNLLTSSFYETNVVRLGLDVLGLSMIGRDVAIQSYDKFLIYFVASILMCSLGASTLAFFRFFFGGNQDALTEPVYGFSSVFFAFLLFQIKNKPSQPVYHLIPQVTFQRLPFFVLCFQVVLRVMGVPFFSKDLIFSVISMHFCWMYLRNFYSNEDGSRGNSSEEFQYVNMYPSILQPVIIPLSAALNNLVAMTGMIPTIEATAPQKVRDHLGRVDGTTDAVASTSTRAQSDVVGERRRAKALKILDAKMAELAAEPQGWDDKEEANTTRAQLELKV
jgi:membrane associated rhomboid family serine protease